MITPRSTRLVRTADLQAFREAVVALASEGHPLDARDSLVVVPTRAAAEHLVRALEAASAREARSGELSAAILPELITPRELVPRLGERLAIARPRLTNAEREVILGVSCRAARDQGAVPPFRLRPGLLAEILQFYDALRRNQKDVDTFERLALGLLEPGASYDRGAERLVRQTRFLVAAFRDFERRCAESGLDEHQLRTLLTGSRSDGARASDTRDGVGSPPWRHVVLTVTDSAFEPHGLAPADWDLLARAPGIERLDVVVTDRMLAGALHERMHRMLPGIDEVRFTGAGDTTTPALVLPPGEGVAHVARDREEEVAGFTRRIKRAARSGALRSLDRAALVVRQPLPYVYVAREVLRSAGVPCQSFDALPLASEPYSAAVDLIFSVVAANFARVPAIALLGSPHFQFTHEGQRLDPRDVVALDRRLSESGFLGDVGALQALVEKWGTAQAERETDRRARRAGEVLLALARELEPLRTPAPAGDHLDRLAAFLDAHDNAPAADDPFRSRQLRARAAMRATIGSLRDAYRRFDAEPVDFEDVSALLRRWIDGQTFAPLVGDSGVHIVDAESARFGAFDEVQLAGLVDGEWPDRPRRNIFYSPSVLRELGWPAESERLDGARAAFADLCRLPSARLIVSAFSLEADSLVSVSPFVEDVEQAGLEAIEDAPVDTRVFEYEALGLEPSHTNALAPEVRIWAERRLAGVVAAGGRVGGYTSPYAAAAYSLSAIERYQDCPFRYFAADVLKLEEAPEDEATFSPQARGRFIHEVFQRFFEAWDARQLGAITWERLDQARAVFAEAAEPLLARLPEAEAALERTRLFGSAISVGIVDVVLGLEAARPVDVHERWLEYRLEGEFSLGADDGRRVPLKGVADRIDLLAGNRLRVIDYKSGSGPNPRRALQVPVYAMAARERLTARDGVEWTIEAASYVALGGKRPFIPVVKAGASDRAEVLAAARGRLFDVLDGIGRGEFPPRPHDEIICRFCAYPSVCRKDYAGGD